MKRANYGSHYTVFSSLLLLSLSYRYSLERLFLNTLIICFPLRVRYKFFHLLHTTDKSSFLPLLSSHLSQEPKNKLPCTFCASCAWFLSKLALCFNRSCSPRANNPSYHPLLASSFLLSPQSRRAVHVSVLCRCLLKSIQHVGLAKTIANFWKVNCNSWVEMRVCARA